MTILREYTEGRATFVSADVDQYSPRKGQPTASMPVFYNPRMRLNRDLSVLVLDAMINDYKFERICEPLAGCGVRVLRYLMECKGDFVVSAFDANPNAVEVMRTNVARHALESRANIVLGDARTLLISESRGRRFDFVDIDPFGSPAPYLNAAMQSMRPIGGMLAATATDMPVLCGVHPRIAVRKYGGLSSRTPFSKEIGVRLLIGLIFHIAGLNDLSMKPLVSLSADHYIRVWAWISENRSQSNSEVSKIGFFRYCRSCMQVECISLLDLKSSPELQHQVESCQGPVALIGPLWIGELFDEQVLHRMESLLPNHYSLDKRVWNLVDDMIQEHQLTDKPYLDLHALCDTYGLVPPLSRNVRQVLAEMGHKVTRTHFSPTSIRTDAAIGDVVDAIRKAKEVS